jgi:hypothetical protein
MPREDYAEFPNLRGRAAHSLCHLTTHTLRRTSFVVVGEWYVV